MSQNQISQISLNTLQIDALVEEELKAKQQAKNIAPIIARAQSIHSSQSAPKERCKSYVTLNPVNEPFPSNISRIEKNISSRNIKPGNFSIKVVAERLDANLHLSREIETISEEMDCRDHILSFPNQMLSQAEHSKTWATMMKTKAAIEGRHLSTESLFLFNFVIEYLKHLLLKPQQNALRIAMEYLEYFNMTKECSKLLFAPLYVQSSTQLEHEVEETVNKVCYACKKLLTNEAQQLGFLARKSFDNWVAIRVDDSDKWILRGALHSFVFGILKEDTDLLTNITVIAPEKQHELLDRARFLH